MSEVLSWELGKKAGVNLITVGRLETGRRPAQLDTVRKLAGALRVEPSDLGKEVKP